MLKQKSVRIAFDLGGVIVKRGLVETRQNFIVQQSKAQVKFAIQKFGPENVFIISKAKQKYIKGNIELLQKHAFFSQIGFLRQNVCFVEKKEEKGELGRQLKIDYIVDDSTKVAEVVIDSGWKPILFGDHEQFIEKNPNIINAKSWKEVRQILQKIQN